METIANKDSAAKKKKTTKTKKINFFYYTIKHSVRYRYPSFRKNKQTNKQTKNKTKQNKTKQNQKTLLRHKELVILLGKTKPLLCFCCCCCL